MAPATKLSSAKFDRNLCAIFVVLTLALALAQICHCQHANSTANNTPTSNSSATEKTLLLFSPASLQQTSTTTNSPPTPIASLEDNDENDAGTVDDDYVTENSAALPESGPSSAQNTTQLERLVALQESLRAKTKKAVKSTLGAALLMNEALSLTGACSAASMDLVNQVAGIKSFAFKFLDASAKLPSGLLSGLLSDFGDYDECLSIRRKPQTATTTTKAVRLAKSRLLSLAAGHSEEFDSNANTQSADHQHDDNPVLGKYCLFDVKLNYHIELNKTTNEGHDESQDDEPTAPPGIQADGVLWDELIRHYWTRNVSKGFQLAVCVPSKCTDDDVGQIVAYFAPRFGLEASILRCQDDTYLTKVHTRDTLQTLILITVYVFVALNVLGSLVDRYVFVNYNFRDGDGVKGRAFNSRTQRSLPVQLLVCFSLQRNWRHFIGATANDNTDSGKQSNQRLVSPTTTTTTFVDSSPSSSNRSSETSSHVDMTALETPHESSQESGTPTSSSPHHCISAEESQEQLSSNRANNLKLNLSFGREQPTPPPSPPLQKSTVTLSHLAGIKLLLVCWIAMGHSFLYPSSSNYSYYRSIGSMTLTRESLWFATANFTLAIDALIYIAGLMFAYKLLLFNGGLNSARAKFNHANDAGETQISCLQFIGGKILRLWPTYLAAIGFAVMVPLYTEGPMWPEMIVERLGSTCRRQWLLNLLFVNNFSDETQICLPSSWFVSVLMQCFVVGSLVLSVSKKFGFNLSLLLTLSLLVASGALTLSYAHLNRVKAPLVRIDESFIVEQDKSVFGLYTSPFSCLGPFLVGLLGGHCLYFANQSSLARKSRKHLAQKKQSTKLCAVFKFVWLSLVQLSAFVLALGAGLLVLSTVFIENYSPLESAVYWTLHRIAWAGFVGYVVHKCAINDWQLLADLLSLQSLQPLAKLTFIAYLLHPIFIHIHTGLVRDGLHVSNYNMANIYIARLFMTFTAAALIYLLIALPSNKLQVLLLGKLAFLVFGKKGFVGSNSTQAMPANIDNNNNNKEGQRRRRLSKIEPLLKVASMDYHASFISDVASLKTNV